MSARAVGAHLLQLMEKEELVEKCTLDAFCLRFSVLIEEELRTTKREKWNTWAERGARYAVRERLWKNWRERTERDIERRYDARVAAWGDWWVARYDGVSTFIMELLEKIERRVSESFILQAQDEAREFNLMWELERLFVSDSAA